jgi:hypothetical protein
VSEEPDARYGGITISGGTVSGAFAAGPHAQARYQTAAQLDEDVLADLRQLTERHQASLAAAEEALRDAIALTEETRKPQPDRDRVVGILQRLAQRGKALLTVGRLVEEAHQLTEHILR